MATETDPGEEAPHDRADWPLTSVGALRVATATPKENAGELDATSDST